MARTTTKKRAPPPSSDEESNNASPDEASSDDAAAAATQNKKKKAAAGKKKTDAAAQKGKGKKGRAPDDDDDEEEEGVEAPKKKKGGKAKVTLTDEERDKVVNNMARYALFCESTRKLIKREEMSKAVDLASNGGAGTFKDLLPKVNKLLKDLLGMELVILRSKEASIKTTSSAYILRSTLPSELLAKSFQPEPLLGKVKSVLEYDQTPAPEGGHAVLAETWAWNKEELYLRDVRKEEGAAYGVLGVILALILVNSKQLGEDQLVSYLKKLSLHPDTVIPFSIATSHATRASEPGLTLMPFLALLAKQGYLEATKPKARAPGVAGAASQAASKGGGKKKAGMNDGGDPDVTWRWGARSDAEIGEVGIANFIKVIYESRLSSQDDDDDEEEEEGEEEGGEKRGKRARGHSGEQLLNEIARASDQSKLAEARDVKGLGLA